MNLARFSLAIFPQNARRTYGGSSHFLKALWVQIAAFSIPQSTQQFDIDNSRK
jgi:hypothetical protein